MNISQEMYDRICAMLTDYEHPEDGNKVSSDDFYELLVDIVNEACI